MVNKIQKLLFRDDCIRCQYLVNNDCIKDNKDITACVGLYTNVFDEYYYFDKSFYTYSKSVIEGQLL